VIGSTVDKGVVVKADWKSRESPDGHETKCGKKDGPNLTANMESYRSGLLEMGCNNKQKGNLLGISGTGPPVHRRKMMSLRSTENGH